MIILRNIYDVKAGIGGIHEQENKGSDHSAVQGNYSDHVRGLLQHSGASIGCIYASSFYDSYLCIFVCISGIGASAFLTTNLRVHPGG